MSAIVRINIVEDLGAAELAGASLRKCFDLLDAFDWPDLLKRVEAAKATPDGMALAEGTVRSINAFLGCLRMVKADVDMMRMAP